MERVSGLLLRYPADVRVKSGLFQREGHISSPFGTSKIGSMHLGSKYMFFFLNAETCTLSDIKQVMFVNTYGARCRGILTLPNGCTCQKRSILKRRTHMIVIWDIQNWVKLGSKYMLFF